MAVTLWEVILIGVSLSMDAFAVSVADGMVLSVRKRAAFLIALTFGVFQALMPMAGYALVMLCGRLGQAAYDALHRYGHWVAMALLCLLGGKMIVEGLRSGSPRPQETATAKLTPITLLAQGVATSIDALAVGISLGAVGGGIVRPALVIGVTTTVICLPAVYLGRRAERLLGRWATVAGGAVLVAIGVASV